MGGFIYCLLFVSWVYFVFKSRRAFHDKKLEKDPNYNRYNSPVSKEQLYKEFKLLMLITLLVAITSMLGGMGYL